ncbi:HAD family hydrolase [Pseudomonas sp. NPDC087615]|uniref:HAD family hydrolase n=1 Tax=Pseudomonas sp. NPDC087615 TaxID=3364443 RepID=UPI00380463B1
MSSGEQWIVFDYGGTLASSSPRITCDNLGDYFSRLLPASLEEAFRAALERTWHEAAERGRSLALDVSLCSILHDVLRELNVPFIGTQNIVDSFLRQLGDGIVTPSAAAAVHELKRMGYKIGLASNTLRSSKVRRESLRQAAIDDAFSAIIISSEIGFRKPHPVFFEILLRRIGASPEQVIFVGDTWHKDVLAPVESGMRAIWMAGSNQADPASVLHSTPFVTDLSQLPSVLPLVLAEMRLPC